MCSLLRLAAVHCRSEFYFLHDLAIVHLDIQSLTFVSSKKWWFPSLPYALWPWPFWRQLLGYLCLPHVISWLDCSYVFLTRITLKWYSFSVQFIKGYIMSTWLIICGNYNHLVEVMSVGSLHCKVSIFPFVAGISEQMFVTVQISSFSSNFHPLISAHIPDLSCKSSNEECLFPSFLIHWLIELFWKKELLLLPWYYLLIFVCIHGIFLLCGLYYHYFFCSQTVLDLAIGSSFRLLPMNF